MESLTISLEVAIYNAARDGKIWFSLGKLFQLSWKGKPFLIKQVIYM